MGTYKWILLVAFVSLASSETRNSWDIPFQLNRKYGLTAMTSDLIFPMEIKPPSSGELYSVPAQTFFSDKQLPDTTLYMQLNFQPNLTLDEFYFLTIRDPDGVLRLSLSMFKSLTYRVQLRYNPLDSTEGEQTIEFPYAQSQSYWRLGVWIKENTIEFFTNCPQMQSAPFHESPGIKLLGRPLFREGASAFMLNSGVQSNPMHFEGVLTEFTLHTGHDATKAPCKSIEPKQESGESTLDFDFGFGNVITSHTQIKSTNVASSEQVSCHYYPIIDLTDGTVRLFDPTTFTLLMDSHVKDGRVYLNNGTSLQVCENFVKADDDDVQRTVIVDLGSGGVELRDLLSGKASVYSNVTSGFRMRHSTPRVRPVLVWRNITAMVDTWSGKWTVKLPGSDVFKEVEKIKHGIIYMPSGEKVSILLKIKNPKYALTLEPHWGTVSVYRKLTGHLYGRVSYAPSVISTDTPEENSMLANLVDSTGSPIANMDVTVSTEPPGMDTNECKYSPAIDLTNGTIYLYDPDQRKVLMDSEVRDGIAYYKNGTNFKVCDTFVAFDESEATITLVNLTTGDSFLFDRDSRKSIYKSDVFKGFPHNFNSTRTVVAWKNVKVQIDTRSGDWIVQDPESGQLRKAKEIINGKVIMPDGEIIPIQLKIYNKDFKLILEPIFGSIGVYRKSDGELYGRLLYNQRGKRDLDVQNSTTAVPLQRAEGWTETSPLPDLEVTLVEDIPSEVGVAEMLTELYTESYDNDFQESTSSSMIDIRTESAFVQNTGGIDNTEVFDLSTESNSDWTSTILTTLQSFFSGSGFSSTAIQPISMTINLSTEEGKISSSDSTVNIVEGQPESGPASTSIQDGDDAETQSTEIVGVTAESINSAVSRKYDLESQETAFAKDMTEAIQTEIPISANLVDRNVNTEAGETWPESETPTNASNTDPLNTQSPSEQMREVSEHQSSSKEEIMDLEAITDVNMDAVSSIGDEFNGFTKTSLDSTSIENFFTTSVQSGSEEEFINIESRVNDEIDDAISSSTTQVTTEAIIVDLAIKPGPNLEINDPELIDDKNESQGSEEIIYVQGTSTGITEFDSTIEGASEPSFEIEKPDKTFESVPILTEKITESSDITEQELDSNNATMDVTSTVRSIEEVANSTTEFLMAEDEQEPQATSESEIPAIDQERQETFGQTLTEVRDSNYNPLENAEITVSSETVTVQSEASIKTENHFSREQNSLIKSDDLKSIYTTEAKINTETSFSVSEADDETGFGTASDILDTISPSNVVNVERSETETILTIAQTLLPTKEGEKDSITEVGSYNDMETSSDNEMNTAEWLKEISTTESVSSDANADTETSLINLEGTGQTIKAMSTTSKQEITESRHSSELSDETIAISAESDQTFESGIFSTFVNDEIEVGTSVNPDSPETTTLVTDIDASDLELISESETQTNDLRGSTTSEVTDVGETTAITEAVSVLYESDANSIASDVKEIGALTEALQTTYNMDETLRSEISTEVTGDKVESEEVSSGQDIKTSEAISEAINLVTKVEETTEPLKPNEFEIVTISDELTSTLEVDTERTSAVSEEIKSDVTGNCLSITNSDVNASVEDTDTSSAPEEMHILTGNDLTISNEIIQSLTTDQIETEREFTLSSQFDAITTMSDIITHWKSDTEVSVTSVNATETEQFSAAEVISIAGNLTEQPSTVFAISSKEAKPETTSAFEITSITKEKEYSGSSSKFETDHMTTDSSYIEGGETTSENSKASLSKTSDSSSTNSEDMDKFSTTSIELVTSSEESSVSVFSDGISVEHENKDEMLLQETEKSGSTSRCTVLIDTEAQPLNTETVSTSADVSNVLSEGSKITISDKEVEEVEYIDSTAATDMITENRELSPEAMETNNVNVAETEIWEIAVNSTSESDITDSDITQETNSNVDVIETTKSSNDDVMRERSSTSEATHSGQDSTVVTKSKDAEKTVETGQNVLFSVTGSMVSESVSKADAGEVSDIAEIGVTREFESVEIAIEESLNIKTEASDNTDQLITNSKVTPTENIESLDDSTSTDVNEAVTTFSSGEKSTESAISEMEIMVTSSYETETSSKSAKEIGSRDFDEISTDTSSTTDHVIELNSSTSEYAFETDVSSTTVDSITACGLNEFEYVNALAEVTDGIENSDFTSSIVFTSDNEAEAIIGNSATGEKTATDEMVTISNLNIASTTITEAEEGMSGSSVTESVIRKNLEIIPTATVETITISTKEIGNELILSSETETASENLSETVSEDLKEKSEETTTPATKADMTSSTTEEDIIGSFESLEAETIGDANSDSNCYTPGADVENEIIEENSESPAMIPGTEKSLDQSIGSSTITEKEGSWSYKSVTEALYTEANSKDISTATVRKLTSSEDELKSYSLLSPEAITVSEIAEGDLIDYALETDSTKSEMDASSSFLINNISREFESMEVENVSDKTSDSVNNTSMTHESENHITKESTMPSEKTDIDEVRLDPNVSTESVVGSVLAVETEENLSSPASISDVSEKLSASTMASETDEVGSEEVERSTELSRVTEIEDISAITFSNTKMVSSGNKEINDVEERTESSIPYSSSLETDISTVEATLESTNASPLEMIETVESIVSDTTVSFEAVTSSSENEYGSDSSELSSKLQSSATSSEEESEPRMTSAENTMPSGTADVYSKNSESNFKANEADTNLVSETKDNSALPNFVTTPILEHTNLNSINEQDGMTNSIGLSTEDNEIEDITEVYESVSSSDSLETSYASSKSETESSQGDAETIETSFTDKDEERSSEQILSIETAEDKKATTTEMLKPDESTELTTDEYKTAKTQVDVLTSVSEEEDIDENHESRTVIFDNEMTSTLNHITDETTYPKFVESIDSSSMVEINETVSESVATNAVQFTSSDSSNSLAYVTSSEAERPTTAEPLVDSESEMESGPIDSKIIDTSLSPNNLGVNEDVVSSLQTDSASEKLSSTSPLPTLRSNCDLKVIAFCQMLSRAVVASGIQVEDDDDDDDFTTTTEEPTTNSIPDTTASVDDEHTSTDDFSSDVTTSSISTMISFTSDPNGKSEHGYLIPIVDLSDMTVRIFNTKENRILENARIENGYLQFENGTSILIGDVQGISPSENTANNVVISVDLDNGTTSLVDLETGTVITSRKSSEGIPPEVMRNYNEGALFEILSGNMIIQVDTINGGWTVQDANTGNIHLVQEIKDGTLYLANGEEIRLPTAGNDAEVMAIDAINGIVRSVNKETGEIRIILPPTEEPEIPPDETSEETVEGNATLKNEESIPETEITTGTNIPDTTEVEAGESSAEEISTETSAFDMSVTIPQISDSVMDSNSEKDGSTTESLTSIDAEESTNPVATETVVSSEEQENSITETPGTQDADVSDTSNVVPDSTKNLSSSEEADVFTTEIPTTVTEDSESASDSESDTTTSADIWTFTNESNEASLDSSTSDPFTELPETESSANAASTTDPVDSESASESPGVTSEPTIVDEITTEGGNSKAEEEEEDTTEQRSNRSAETQVEEGELTDFPAIPDPSPPTVENQQSQEILRPDCACLEKLLTPELVNKLRENNDGNLNTTDKMYDELFRTPSFLRVVREVIDEYFEEPGVPERYKPNCNCPVNNGCSCPAPEPPPPYNISSSSQHILGALKDMSNGAIIMSNKTTLTKIASGLALGSMVYLNAEDMFYLKVDDQENIWRTIDMNTQSESVRIPEPEPITTTTVKPSLADHLIGRSLMLVGHNEPLDGQLRFGAKLNGGHSSAIFACQRAAKRYNVSHILYPLMSTDIFNMDYVVPPMYRYDMPIVNLKGETIFDDFMHLIEGQQAAMASIYTFDGKELDSDPTVPCAWIGAKPIYMNGDYEYAARSKCRNWQSREPTETGLAVHIPMNTNATAFLDQSNLYNESCAKRCSVLCIQISPN